MSRSSGSNKGNSRRRARHAKRQTWTTRLREAWRRASSVQKAIVAALAIVGSVALTNLLPTEPHLSSWPIKHFRGSKPSVHQAVAQLEGDTIRYFLSVTHPVWNLGFRRGFVESCTAVPEGLDYTPNVKVTYVDKQYISFLRHRDVRCDMVIDVPLEKGLLHPQFHFRLAAYANDGSEIPFLLITAKYSPSNVPVARVR